MKAYPILLLLVAVSVLPARGQNGASDPFPLVPYVNVPDRAQKPLQPATAPDARYPLRVEIVNGTWKYTGNHFYKGTGTARVDGATSQDMLYQFGCVNSFVGRGKTYQARWVKPGEKLEILMGKPHSTKTEACKLSTRS